MNRTSPEVWEWNEWCNGLPGAAGERPFRLFFERSADPTWLLDAVTGTVLDCNHAARLLAGCDSRDELLGRPFDESFLEPATGGGLTAALARAVAGTAPEPGNVTCEGMLRRLDGVRVPVEVTATAVLTGTHRVAFVVCRDISARKQAQAAAREQAQLLASVADNIREAIYRSGPDHQLTFVNQAYLRLFGYESLAQLRAIPRERLYADPAHRPRLLAALRDQGFFQNEEAEYVRRDGSRFWGLANAVAIRDPQTGTLLYHVGSVIDITERKQAADAVRELNANLERRVAERTAALSASEARQRTLVEHAPEAIVVFDGETGRFVVCNENAVRLYGLAREDLLRCTPADVSPELQPDGRRSADAAREWMIRASAGETPVFEWTHRGQDGRLVPCEIRLVRLPGEGAPLIRGSVIDNTERHRRERIQQATYRVSQAVQAADDLPSLFSRIHETVRGLMPANNFYIALRETGSEWFAFPYFVDEIDPLPPPLKLTTGLSGVVIRTGKALLVNRRTPIDRRADGVALLPNGTEAGPYEERGTPAAVWLGAPLNVSGRTLGVIAVQDYRDESAYGEEEKRILTFIAEQTALAIERKRAEAELLQSLAREKELSQLKSNFVSLVSHEFRTPLGIILSSAEILRDYFDQLGPEERLEQLRSIQTNTRRMAELMEDVLLLGRFEAGGMDCQPVAVQLPQLCRGIVEDVLAATAQTCPIHLRLDPSLGSAQLDDRLFRHILTNLLSNAVKYSAPGTPVEFTLARQEQTLIAAIRDRGLGIPESDREWLFKAFHRGRNVGSRPGSGLGLVIVKHCVDLHGGSIDVHTELGHGSTFTLRLPAFPPNPTPQPP